MAGTPGFAAPEQFLESYQIDSSADLYSFGRLLVFMTFEWESAFTLLYQPFEKMNLKSLFAGPYNNLLKLRNILSKFMEPQPTKRIVRSNYLGFPSLSKAALGVLKIKN